MTEDRHYFQFTKQADLPAKIKTLCGLEGGLIAHTDEELTCPKCKEQSGS